MPGQWAFKARQVVSFFRAESRMNAAVIIRRIGPYHAARLVALGKVLNQLTAIEIAAADRTYAWDMVHRLGSTDRRTLFATEAGAKAAPLWRAVADTLTGLHPDVVAIPGWGDPAALAALAWCRQQRAAVILMSDSTEWDAPRLWWQEMIKTSIVKTADAAFVAGTPHQRYIEKLGMDAARIVTGYDVVDHAYFADRADQARLCQSKLREEHGLPERFVLSICRFVEKKNLARLLDAQAIAAKANPTQIMPLVLVGGGPLEPALRARAAETDLAEHVFIKPFAQYQKLPLLYGLASGFVLASTVEQWGLVINEAMACALPVLASSRCGAAEDLIVEGQTGFLANPFDLGSLADGLTKVWALSDEQREQMGRAARARVAAWGPERFAAGFCEAASLALIHAKRRRWPALAPVPYLKAIASLQ